MFIGIRKPVPFRIEKVDLAFKLLALVRHYFAMLHLARGPVITTAHFAVPQFRFQSGCDLHIGAHFQNAVFGATGRRNLQCLDEPGNVGFGVVPRFAAPTDDVFRLYLWLFGFEHR